MSGSPDPSPSNRKRKAELRAQLRKRRRSLSPDDRTAANRRICTFLQQLPAFKRARNVATYLAFDGEPSLASLLRDKRNAAKRFYVPVLQSKQMRFAPIYTHKRLRRNSFGIAEPPHRERVPSRRLDIVLVPLVGFDENGDRLGMGGGYYDRHFSYLRARSCFVRPRLIGVAYELQCVSAIPKDAWDIPLWAIVTDAKFRKR